MNLAQVRWTVEEYCVAIGEMVMEGYSDDDIMALVAKVRAGFTAAGNVDDELEKHTRH